MIKMGYLVPYFSLQYGGPVMVILELVKHLNNYPIKTTVYASSEVNASATQRTYLYQKITPNFIIKRFNSYLRFRDYRINLGLLRTLLKDYKNIDIFHSHAVRSFQEDIAALISIIKKKKLIITTHGNLCANFKYFEYLYKRIYDLTDTYLKNKLLDIDYIAISKIEIEFLKKYGIEDEKIHFIPHGVNTNLFQLTDSTNFINKYNLTDLLDKNVIVYVGRLAERKGIDVLVNAFALLQNEIPDSRLIIAGGETRYKEKIIGLVKQHKIQDKVRFLGFIPKIELPQVYSIANVVVYPSKFEIFGNVITEANACEKVVIASDHWGPKEVILDGKTGFLTKYGDIEGLKEKIAYVLSNEELQQKIGKFARKYVKSNYSWKINAQKHYKLYKDVLK